MKQIVEFIVIDDDATNNLICKLMLVKLVPGVQISTFTDPEEGFQYLKSTLDMDGKRVLFLDLNMPVMSGWEVLDALANVGLKQHGNLLIHILTSSIDERDKIKAKEEYQIESFISKPLLREHVIDILNQLKD